MSFTARRASHFLAAALLLVAAGCSKGAAATGEPGSAAEVDRVVEIETTNELRFDPSEVDVQVGETIEFNITNVASSEHEFVLGAVAHEHTDGMSHGESNATGTIEPGSSASVIWHFTEAGEVAFACHVAGHGKQGMTGTITISE